MYYYEDKIINKRLRGFNNKCDKLAIINDDRALLLSVLMIGKKVLMTSSVIYNIQYGDDFDLFLNFVIGIISDDLPEKNQNVIKSEFEKLKVYDKLYDGDNITELLKELEGHLL